jgi:hypothetical protein
MSVLQHHWKKMLVATNKYCGERKKDEEEKGRVMERRSRKERLFSCIEFSAKSESIMAEAIELSGTSPEARPREKLGSLVQSLLHPQEGLISVTSKQNWDMGIFLEFFV